MLPERSILVVNVYMPVGTAANLVEFTDILGSVSAIIDSCNIDCIFVLGDFNAHPTEQFYNELSLFCEDQEWTCIDLEMLRGVSNSSDCFTFVSEAHGSQRWLDQCIVSKAAVPSVCRVFVKYYVLWSDHFPLIMECNLGIISPKILDCKSTVNEVIWGERTIYQVSQYRTECHRLLRLLNFPEEFIECPDYTCNILQHRQVIDRLYNNIVKILKEAALFSKRSKYLRKKKTPVAGWNLHVSEAHREARRTFNLW